MKKSVLNNMLWNSVASYPLTKVSELPHLLIKKGIIKEIDTRHGHVTTFLDDLVGAIVAAVCGKLSHEYA